MLYQGMGRPRFLATDEQRKWVKGISSLGIPQDDIALLLDMTAKTLRKHFRKELTHGSVEAKAKVLETLYGMATSGKNTAATIFYVKTRCGLKERESDSLPPQIVIRTEP
jgi:hypothetical protein